MYQQAKRSAALAALLMIAGLSMGNQSCEEAKTRILKMDVELSSIRGRSIRMPNGELVDFPFAVNQHFYRQVMNSDHFVIVNTVPSPISVPNARVAAQVAAKAQQDGEDIPLAPGDVSPRDLKLLKDFGFTRQLYQDASNDSGAHSSKTTLPLPALLPSCLYDMPQALLGGDILSFEASWGAGLGIGYGADGALDPGNVGGSINFSNSRLELGLLTQDPLTGEAQVTGDGVAHQSNVGFKFDFVPGVPVGLSFFFHESLSNTIRAGLDRGLDSIVNKYVAKKGTWDETWESRVIFDPEIANNDTHFAIRGGERNGIVLGDEFKITNMHYRWEGEICESRMKSKLPRTDQPSVDITIVGVGDNIAVGKINSTGTSPDVRILPGAQVKILKLYQPPQPAKNPKNAQSAAAITQNQN